MDNELKKIYSRFSDEAPAGFQVISTGRSESDFRDTVIVTAQSGSRLVLKISDNDFTFPEKIKMWQRTVNEYRALGCYCPLICTDKSGGFPYVSYQGRRCVVYAEEFSLYSPAEERETDFADYKDDSSYMPDAWLLTAKVAAKRFDYTEYPSAYCLFETFCPSDKTDEVTENALEWFKAAEALPRRFRPQAEHIRQLWEQNRSDLEGIYRQLPTSVFQADLNSTNILLDENRRFKGLIDFNLCGRDVFLNYLMRENNSLDRMKERIRLVSSVYEFSALEKQAAPLLFRCINPLWSGKADKLRSCMDDEKALAAFLNDTERLLTEDAGLFE